MKSGEEYVLNRYRTKFSAWTHIRSIKNKAELADTVAFLMQNEVSSTSIAHHLSVSGDRIRHLYRLARRLCHEVKVMWWQGSITTGHARAIAGLPYEEQIIVARKVAAGSLGTSVRELESMRRREVGLDVFQEPAYLERVQAAISSVVGHSVKVNKRSYTVSARCIVVECADVFGFEALCSRLGITLSEITH